MAARGRVHRRRALLTIAVDGSLRIDRGYVRAEDEPKPEPIAYSDSVMVEVIALSLRYREAAPRCFPGPRERWGLTGKSGFAGTRLHGAEAQRRRRKLGGRRFGGEKGQSPLASSAPRLRRCARQGSKPNGRDAALQAARAQPESPARRETPCELRHFTPHSGGITGLRLVV